MLYLGTTNSSNSNVCTPYYSLSDGNLFSWDNVKYQNLKNLKNMTKEAILDHGRFCKSGFAYRFDADRASCINIAKISIDNDKPDATRVGAVKCDFSAGLAV